MTKTNYIIDQRDVIYNINCIGYDRSYTNLKTKIYNYENNIKSNAKRNTTLILHYINFESNIHFQNIKILQKNKQFPKYLNKFVK